MARRPLSPVKAHEHADNWFEQSPLGGILVQEKWIRLQKP